MNGRGGGCCIAKYGTEGGGVMYGMSKVDRIMLKYRPIAPKPVAAGSGSGGSTTESSDGYVKCVRNKRKYVRVNKNRKKDNYSKKRKVTLSLLPETPDRKKNKPVTGFLDLLSPVQKTKCNCSNNRKSVPEPVWLSFNTQELKVDPVGPVLMKPTPPPAAAARRPQVVSYVTVECVTDTWVDLEGLRCRDEERVMNMEKDTCPGFISDGQDKVLWTNKAYKQMAGGGEDMVVVLVRKDKWMPSSATYPAFTCKVRVTSAAHSHQPTPSPSSPTLTLPCDVWRMERGAYAWRLDVKAALSLGR